MVYKEGSMKLDTGIEVFYREWIPETSKGLVIGIHGFVEHSGRYSEFGEFLEKNGYSLSMYDLRGHGKTAGHDDFGSVDRFNRYFSDTESFATNIMKEHNVDSAFIIGHSMGGLIALYVLARAKIPLKGGVTSGPALLLASNVGQKIGLILINTFSPKKRLKLPLNPEFLSHDPNVGKSYMEDPLVCKNPSVELVYQMYQASKSSWELLPTIRTPLLMLHGADDKIVPPKATLEGFDSIPSKDKNKKLYPGFYHEILQETGKYTVYSDILNWISIH